MRKIPHFSPEEMQEMEAQMVREIPQLSPETMQEMERQHQALLAAYAEKKERLMQGDMTVLEDAFSRLLTESERKIIEMAYGIGIPKMTVGQIAESLGQSVMDTSMLLFRAKYHLGRLYVKLLELLSRNDTPRSMRSGVLVVSTLIVTSSP